MSKNGRVNMIVTKDSIKYTYQEQAGVLKGVPEIYGEHVLPKGTMKDGAINDHAVFIASVKELVKSQKWRRNSALAFCLVDDTVYIRELQIPGLVTQEEAVEFIYTQSDDYDSPVDIPFDNPIIVADVLNQEAGITFVRFYAYPKDKLDEFEDAFEEAGLEPEIADFTFLSSYRYYTEVVARRKKRVLSINWSETGIYVSGFEHDRPFFNRYIRFNLDSKSSIEMALSSLKDVMSDILNMVLFYEDAFDDPDDQFEEILLLGGFVHDTLTEHMYLAEQLLIETLGLPVRDLLAEAHDTGKRKEYFIGGETGRTTRRIRPGGPLRRSEQKRLSEAKYIDLFGLCLKPEIKEEPVKKDKGKKQRKSKNKRL